MKKISLLRFEYNDWNGFIFQILSIEIGRFDGDLFSINLDPFCKDKNRVLAIEIFFIRINFILPI